MKTDRTTKAKLNIFYFPYLVLIFLVAACSNTKQMVYFNGIHDATVKSQNYNIETPIQSNDLLSITVSSANPDASAPFNAPNESTPITSSATSNSNTLTIGYLVNLDGDIQFPVLGKIHAAGLNKSQLTDKITKELLGRKLLVDPIVTIRHLNFRVSVLGEVAKPGVFITPNEKLSLLEALSFAGDLTIYGKRDNILLIRENDKGEKLVKRLDLTSQKIFASPYYYLKSNDVLYVEPTRNRVAKERNAQLLPVVLSVISLIIISITSFRR